MNEYIDRSFKSYNTTGTDDIQLDSDTDSNDTPHYLDHIRDSRSRYIDRTLIGMGALKEVYKCYDDKLKRHVALAKTKEGLDQDADEKLVYEAWITSGLNHPNIIKIHGIDCDEHDRPFFTMDLKDNNTLHSFLEQKPNLVNRLDIFKKVCDAIAYAHSCGVIHLDLKPANIQCGQYGEVIVCDWGLSKRFFDTNEDIELSGHLLEVSQDTLYGEIKGSLGYLAPEQVIPDAIKCERTDIYALGCILYFLLTGHPPQEGEKKDILLNVRDGVISPPSEKFPEARVPKSLNQIIIKALAPAPAERYQSVTHLSRDIDHFLSGRLTSTDRPSFLRSTALFLQRHQRETFISCAAILLISIVSVLFNLKIQEEAQVAHLLEKEKHSLDQQLTISESEYATLEKEASHQAQISNTLSNLLEEKDYIFWKTPPLELLEKDIAISREIHRLFPDDLKVRETLFKLYCIQMNFKAACAVLPKASSPTTQLLVDYFQRYAQYDFSLNSRPSFEQILTFLNDTADLPPHYNTKERKRFIGAMMYYHYSTGAGRKLPPHHKNQLACATIKNLNYNTPDFIVNYRRDLSKVHNKRTFHIKSQRDFQDHGPWSTRRVFEQIHVDYFHLEVSGTFYLSALNEMHTRELKLSSINSLRFNKPITIKGLQKLSILNGEFSESELRKFIKSDYKYKIVSK